MSLTRSQEPAVTDALLEAIQAFPAQRQVRHCDSVFEVPSLDLYAACPTCGKRIKVRSFSGAHELEDVFDAVLDWMQTPEAQSTARQRLAEIQRDAEAE